MPDAPLNLPFEPPMNPPTSIPPVPPPAPIPPPSPAMPPMPVPPLAPVPRPPLSAQGAGGAVAQDVFADLEPTTPPVQAMPPVAERPSITPASIPVHGGHGKSLAIVAVVVFLLAAGGAGALWAYGTWKERQVNPSAETPVAPTSSRPVLPPPAQVPSNFDDPTSTPSDAPVEIVPLPTPVTTPPANVNVPPPMPVNPDAPPIPTAPSTGVVEPFTPATSTSATPLPAVEFDTDGDGLTDTRERELGTNELKRDTDGDTINDGLEVQSYGTNPLNADTDADAFPDGIEINNGYNPRGTGRCSRSDCRI